MSESYDEPSWLASNRRYSPPGPKQAPWTARRCHRLLRPLLSHISALKKESNRVSAEVVGAEEAAPSAFQARRHAALRKRGNDEAAFVKPRKKIRHKYSVRNVPTSLHTTSGNGVQEAGGPGITTVAQLISRPEWSPGRVALPTPVLRKVRENPLCSPTQPSSPLRKVECEVAHVAKQTTCMTREARTKPALESKLLDLRPTTQASKYAHYESIFRAVDTFLRSTTERSKKRRGPGSLMSMCLCKVPAYIAELEEWTRQEAESQGTSSSSATSNTSFDIYAELEALGGGSSGWRELRLLTRANEAAVLREAIIDGLLEPDFSWLLVRLHAEAGCFVEAEVLLMALVDKCHPGPTSIGDGYQDATATSALHQLCEYASSFGRMPFLLRTLDSLLANGKLPKEWLCTRDMGSVWSSAAKLLCSRRGAGDAMSFMKTAIELLLTQPSATNARSATTISSPFSNAARRTLIGAVAGLAALLTLAEEAIEDRRATRKGSDYPSAIASRVNLILKSSMVQIRSQRHKSSESSSYILQLAAFLADAKYPWVDGAEWIRGIEHAWDSAARPKGYEISEQERLQQQYENTISLVAGISHFCGRGSRTTAHTYLLRHCEQMDSLSIPSRPFKSLRRDAAFLLAEQSSDLRDLAFAEGLACEKCPTELRQTPNRKSVFGGYRWDEGISEWVTNSPELCRKRSAATRDAGDNGKHPERQVYRETDDTPLCERMNSDFDESETEIQAQSSGADEENLSSGTGECEIWASRTEDPASSGDELDMTPGSANPTDVNVPQQGVQMPRARNSLKRKRSRNRLLLSREALKVLDTNTAYLAGSSDDELAW